MIMFMEEGMIRLVSAAVWIQRQTPSQERGQMKQKLYNSTSPLLEPNKL
jgi:hypothetical protein